MQIKLISWNIWKGKNLDQVIEFLREQNADIIGLQEITNYENHEGDKGNVGKKIAQALGMNIHFCKAFTTDRHDPSYEFGNAMLSKFPFKASTCHMLSSMDDYRQSAETEPRVATECVFEIEDKLVSIFNTHLAYSHELKPIELRRKQIEKLVSVLPSTYTVLMGDFNAKPENPDLEPIIQKFKNADPDPDSPSWSMYPRNYKGFEVTGLDYRIDHVFVTDDIRVEKFDVVKNEASDHLPLVMTIDI